MTWAITGVGMVSSLSEGAAGSVDAFARGATSVAPLRAFEPARYRTVHAYELDGRGADTKGRPGAWLADSITQALDQARLTGVRELRLPVLVGTGLAEQRSLELHHTGRTTVTLDELHFAGAVRRATGLDQTLTVVNACSASLFTLAMATDLLTLDEADAVIVAGADSLSECMFGLLDRVNARPPTEVRPFDADRLGVLLGEGAAAIVLESPARAAARGVVPLAFVRGVGTTCDAHHVTAPQRDGIVRAIRDAHDRAGVAPAAVDVVLAHGTGTFLNDQTEGAALGVAFADVPRKPVLTALKSLIGHTSGASGLMSLVTAVDALTTGRVPPTRNHDTPIEQIADFTVVTEPTDRSDLAVAQVNAFGFGGVNAVALVSRAVGTTPVLPPTDVVVTGVGIEIPGATSLADLIAASETGRPLPAVDFEPGATLGQRGLRYKDRSTLLALCAATHALGSSGLPPDALTERHSFGAVVSTELALVESVRRVVTTIHESGSMRCSPMDLPNVSGNVAAAQLAIWFQLGGLNLTVSAGPTSGIDALHQAATAIRSGRATRMLVVGVEPADAAAIDLLAGTAAAHGDDPARVRAFDGAVAVVLESADIARSRGARPLARVGRYQRTVPAGAGTLCFGPCDRHRTSPAPADGAVTLTRVVGEASAALGVLQCAAAATLLGDPGNSSALITAGGCWGAPYASLTLEAVA